MQADRILTNARVLTMVRAAPVAQAVAVAAGRIVAVGTVADVCALAGPHTIVTDLRGRTVGPGFNDSHMHVLAYGLFLLDADLSPQAGVTDVPALAAALRRWADAHPDSAWVRGNRYDQNVYPGAQHPTRQDLDGAFPDRPVYLVHTSEHAAACNSAALRAAGVGRETPDPDGGRIVRGADGEPTGVLLEAAMELVSRHVPQPDRAGMVAAVHRACRELARVGVTAASDLSTAAEQIPAFVQAAEEGAPVRMTLYPYGPGFERPANVPERSRFAADCGLAGGPVRLGPVKFFADGALTTRTAALREPFVDGSGSGMLLVPPDELRAWTEAAHARGWQLATHAIGDRAIDLVLDCYASLPDAEGRRHRVEHAMLLDAALIARLAAQHVIPALQMEFLSRLGDAYILGLGLERASRVNPVASLLRAGLPVPFGSDCPVVPGAPLDGVRAAVQRTTRQGQVLGESERVSAADGLRCYTRDCAYATFDEDEIGTVEEGKRADLVILSADPVRELDAAEVDATMLGGVIVHGAERLT